MFRFLRFPANFLHWTSMLNGLSWRGFGGFLHVSACVEVEGEFPEIVLCTHSRCRARLKWLVWAVFRYFPFWNQGELRFTWILVVYYGVGLLLSAVLWEWMWMELWVRMVLNVDRLGSGVVGGHFCVSRVVYLCCNRSCKLLFLCGTLAPSFNFLCS